MDPHHDLRTDASTVAAVDVGEPTPEPISTEPTPEPTSTDPTSSSEPTSKESTSGETTCTPSEHTYKFEVQVRGLCSLSSILILIALDVL